MLHRASEFMGSLENGSEPLDSIKGGEIPDHLSDC
jgi:hypothetical protein